MEKKGRKEGYEIEKTTVHTYRKLRNPGEGGRGVIRAGLEKFSGVSQAGVIGSSIRPQRRMHLMRTADGSLYTQTRWTRAGALH